MNKLVAIIGCAKTGTTALAHHLARHPEIVLGANKEPVFFTDFAERDWAGPASEGFKKKFVTGTENYLKNFNGIRADQWALDASTDYIWCEKTPQLLAEFRENCDVRLICIIRDPIERAISEYNHTISFGWETLSFGKSIDKEDERMKEGWPPLFYHRRRSTVCRDIQKFSDLFKDKLLIVDYLEMQNPEALMDRICDFLEIKNFPTSLIERRNETFVPRNKLAKNIAESDQIKKVARTLVPSSFRKTIFERLYVNTRKTRRVQDSERAKLVELLSDELKRCVDEPLIPTANWTCL